MPIVEPDPWRQQYFAGIACPDDVFVPTDDCDAWAWYPRHRWVYDKLAVALSQGLDAGPHGVKPTRLPVFSKPSVNLKGMGVGSRVLATADDCDRHFTAGHIWMTLLEGEHVSTDVAVERGRALWTRHATGVPAGEGTFDYWTIHARAMPELAAYLADWTLRHLSDYTGMLNFETIGGRIIEVHLRLIDQWPDLYGREWIEAVVGLYASGAWRFTDADRRDGYSIALFAPHGGSYRHPPHGLLADLRERSGISSLQITFHANRPPEEHAMPPGGFRLALVNCWDLAAGRAVRTALARWFEREGRGGAGRSG